MSTPAGNTASESLGSMYTQHNRWLVSWLQRRFGDRHDAADIAQDTFVRLWSSAKLQPVEDIHEPRAYLCTVARRLMINLLERRSLEQSYLESLRLQPQACVLSVEAQSILLETLAELDTLLGELPAKVRTAFLLSQLEGLSYEEIAEQMQLSVRTVTRYMAQGFRQCLQLMLEA